MRLIKAYCRESGVRNLQKHIEKVRENLLVKNSFFLSLNRFFAKLHLKLLKKVKVKLMLMMQISKNSSENPCLLPIECTI
jgi:ATP-dependent Lon protease